jgi:hypothetical protein
LKRLQHARLPIVGNRNVESLSSSIQVSVGHIVFYVTNGGAYAPP